MKAASIIVGFNHWYAESQFDKRFTQDFVRSLAADNPELDILLVDNASGKPYPQISRRMCESIACCAGSVMPWR